MAIIAILTLSILASAVTIILCMMSKPSARAYDAIKKDGYTGTMEEWLASLVGENAENNTGETAFDIAREHVSDVQRWVKYREK